MSSHYKTKEPLSADLIEKIVKRQVPNFYCHIALTTASVIVDMSTSGCSISAKYFLPNSISKYTQIKARIQVLTYMTSTYRLSRCLEGADYTALWNDLRQSISLVKGGKPSPGQGSFGHITGGYDAGYYGYKFEKISFVE